MSIATKRGDGGETGLAGGIRVSKADLRVESYGSIDELNTHLGFARSICQNKEIATWTEEIQRTLFRVGSALATPPESKKKPPVISTEDVDKLTDLVHKIETTEGILADWSLPGGHAESAAYEMARTVCRRAERSVVRFVENGGVVPPEVLAYLNRLSDVIWLFGRLIEHSAGVDSRLRDESHSGPKFLESVVSHPMKPHPPFNEAEREAVYRAIVERRDVRRGFLDAPLPSDLIGRLLAAAHSAPSVGLMQPSRFIVVRDYGLRKAVHQIFEAANTRAVDSYSGEQAERYSGLKLEGILEAPQNLCVLCDRGSERGHGLGRQTMPETAIYSTVCAIQNLWLAARSEGVGVGWVSILDPAKLCALLNIPDYLTLVAYLCLGYVEGFAAEPDLERLGWERRVDLKTVVSYDRYSEEHAP